MSGPEKEEKFMRNSGPEIYLRMLEKSGKSRFDCTTFESFSSYHYYYSVYTVATGLWGTGYQEGGDEKSTLEYFNFGFKSWEKRFKFSLWMLYEMNYLDLMWKMMIEIYACECWLASYQSLCFELGSKVMRQAKTTVVCMANLLPLSVHV